MVESGIANAIWNAMLRWIYEIIYGAIADCFEMIGNRRMDALYTKVGLFDLWDLLQADALTGYSWRLSRCINYLNDTANEFDSAERSISSQL